MPAEPQAADRALIADARRLLECIRLEERPEELPVEEDGEQHAAHAVCIVSNDLGFDRVLKECSSAGCKTVAISNLVDKQYRHADVTLSWELVQRGPL